MLALVGNVEFWKAIAAMLWPIVVLVIFLASRSRIYAFISRDNVSIKVAGMEINVADVTKRTGEEVADLQKRLARLETKISPGPDPSSPNDTKRSQTLSIEDDQLTSNFRILWVDDYPSNNAFLIDQFRTDGIEIQLALSTDDALKAYQDDRFDLVITDLGRRENGVSNAFAGLALIKEIRKQDPNVPILVYAGTRGIENMVKLKKAGADFVSQSAVELQRVVLYYRQPKTLKQK